MPHEHQSTRFEELLQLLSEHGFDGMAEAIKILMNEAMVLERADVLGAAVDHVSAATKVVVRGISAQESNLQSRGRDTKRAWLGGFAI